MPQSVLPSQGQAARAGRQPGRHKGWVGDFGFGRALKQAASRQGGGGCQCWVIQGEGPHLSEVALAPMPCVCARILGSEVRKSRHTSLPGTSVRLHDILRAASAGARGILVSVDLGVREGLDAVPWA